MLGEKQQPRKSPVDAPLALLDFPISHELAATLRDLQQQGIYQTYLSHLSLLHALVVAQRRVGSSVTLDARLFWKEDFSPGDSTDFFNDVRVNIGKAIVLSDTHVAAGTNDRVVTVLVMSRW